MLFVAISEYQRFKTKTKWKQVLRDAVITWCTYRRPPYIYLKSIWLRTANLDADELSHNLKVIQIVTSQWRPQEIISIR